MANEYQNILIIKMSSLGDIIHALPSLYVLRKHFPKAKITWAVHPQFAAILPGKPWIDEIFPVDRKRINQFSYWRELRRGLHAHHFDLVIDLQMIAKSALVAKLSGCSTRIGYNDGREGSFLVSKPISGPHKHGHIIEQLLDVMRYLGCDVEGIHFPLCDYEKEMGEVKQLLAAHHVESPYVVLVPGTRGERKKWPIAYWGELAKRLAADHIHAVVSGAKGEMPMGEAIAAAADSPYVVNLMGETDLLELVALEKLAALHISSDTGPLHIANAVGTPLIALFGPTLPDRSGPYGNPRTKVLLAEKPGTKECSMGTIPVDAVYAAAKELLDEQSPLP